MTLYEMVSKYRHASFDALARLHKAYDVSIGERKFSSIDDYDQHKYAVELEAYRDEWFHKDYLLSGVEELAEKYIQGVLEAECGVSEVFFIHLIDVVSEPYVEDDFWTTTDQEVIMHVFEVHVDIGQGFTPTEEAPYYPNYGELISCKEVAV